MESGTVDVKQVGRNIMEVLKNGPIHIHSFWAKYDKCFPKPRLIPDYFNLKKRSEILSLCSDSCSVVTDEKGDSYVALPQANLTPKQQGTDQDKKNKKKSRDQTPETMANFNRRHYERYYNAQQPFHNGPRPNFEYNQHVSRGHMSSPYRAPQFHHSPHRQHQPQHSQVQNIDRDQLNTVAADCIDRLAEAKEYVSAERVEKMLIEQFKVNSIQKLGLHRLEQIQCVYNLTRLQAKVNIYIQAFSRVRSIATLYELGEDLKEYDEAKQDFDRLKLGPLAKQPLVYDFFKFPEDKDIPVIRTTDILDHLRDYMSANGLWQTRLEVEEFMKYLQEKYDVDSPYELGLRIGSLALLAGSLKKSQRENGQVMTQAMNKATDEFSGRLREEVSQAFKHLATAILHQELGICKMQEEYTRMTPAKAVDQVFSKVIVLLDSLIYLPENIHPQQTKQRNKLKKEMARNLQVIKSFKNVLNKNWLYASLFHLAVCNSWAKVQDSMQSIIGWGCGNDDEEEDASTSEMPTESVKVMPPPPMGEVVTQIKVFLERCFLHGSLTLAHLARIEKKMLEEYSHFNSFSDLVDMSFIDFITSNEDVKHYLEENGGHSLGSHTGGSRAESGFIPAHNDLHDFIQQAGLRDPSQAAELEYRLCWHYRVLDVKSLGRGSVTNLQAAMGKSQQGNKQHTVFFESALYTRSRQSWQGGADRQVGVLGHQTKEAALLCLQNCPLLTNMADWSHWELVFKPELGKLKDFIRRYGGIHTFTLPSGKSVTTNIVALETSPGTLLKLTADTSPEKFANAALNEDVRSTCGHLLSMITSNKGVDNTPLALLGNHVKTALIKMQASGNSVPGAPGGTELNSDCATYFTLSCLTKLPFLTAQAVASQVFLEPLGQLVGLTKSREALLEKSEGNDESLSRLHLLGTVLGIELWSCTFQKRLEVQQADETIEALADESSVIEILDSSSESDSDTDFLDNSDEDVKVTKVYQDTCKTSVINVDQDGMDDSDQGGNVAVVRATEPVLIDISESCEDSDCVSVGPEPVVDLGPQWHVVQHIRKEEFGINVTLSEDGQRLMLKQQERLGRSLDRLSRDLYSKDTHFVLELIQNADDNSYPDSGVPAVKFLVEKDSISVMNNESGFEERNIRAICDVGRSTKGKHKSGYIGQKGIGFKSVFRVTDRPEIHSGGYHIQFDVKSGPMGYILPHWVSQAPQQSDRWTTQIVLPLKDDVLEGGQVESLAARFQDIHPSLLLFLNRLRSVTVVNKVSDYTVKMQRRDIGNNIVEIRHTTATDRWLVMKKTLDASQISAQAKSGVEVESTEIALAFPIHAVSKDSSQVLPPKQPVFAFLPLRSYGFRFIVQGDFDVPSSREDVDRDSMWNQWLRSNLHTLFVDALQGFKNQPNMSLVDAVCLYTQFIPLEDEVLDFFRPVASLILQQLRAQPCLPTEPLPGMPPQWRLPSQLVETTDGLLKDVVTPQLLQTHLSLSYLNSSVGARMNPTLLTTLGVQKLTTSHLVVVGRALASQMASSPGHKVEMARLSKWFAAVYRSIDEFNIDKDIMAQLETVPMIPLASGEMVRLQDNAVFFPFNAAEKYKQIDDTALLRYLEKDLNTINPDLFSDLDDVTRPQVRRLLEMLGVKKLEPADIIHHHILPILRTLKAHEKPRELLVAYVIFLKEQWDIQPHLVAMDELRSIVVLATNRGMHSPKTANIHFTPAYGNKVDLVKDLPGYSWELIDAIYLGHSKSPDAIQRWHNFFSKLGVLDLLAFSQQTVKINIDVLTQTPWAKYTPVLPPTETEFQLEDCDCAEFTSLVSQHCQPEQHHKQMKLLYELLDSQWESHFVKFSMTQLMNGSGQHIREVETTFGMLLKQLPWVPAIRAHVSEGMGGDAVIQRKHTQLCGEQLFIHAPIMDRLLAHHVPYLHATPNPRSSFLEFLGVRNQVTVELLQGLLVEWSERGDGDDPATLYTSLTHIKALYHYLYDYLTPKQLQDLFHNHPVIFVPTDLQLKDPREVVEGRLLARSEVWWNDPSGLYSKYATELKNHSLMKERKPFLHGVYRNEEDLMLRSARVSAQPTMLEYTDLLIALTQVLPVSRALQDVLLLFSTLGSLVIDECPPSADGVSRATNVMDDHQMAQVIDKLKLQAVAIFPTKLGHWVRLKDSPLIADNKQIEKLFTSKEGVHFVSTGERVTGGLRSWRTREASSAAGMKHKVENVHKFYRACGIGLLSENLQSRCVTESFQPCPAVRQYVFTILPFIQKLLCIEYPDIYDAHVQTGVKDNLAAMQFAQVGKLEVVYSLRPLPDVIVVIREVCKIKDDRELYIDRQRVSEFHEINKELARYFSRGDDRCMKEIRSLLLELLPLVQNASPELVQFLEQHDLEELPDTEEPWVIPPPVVVRSPSPEISEACWPEVDRQSEGGQSTSSSGTGGLRAWPPRSQIVSAPSHPGSAPPRPQTSMWPPPAPPSHINRSQVPAGLRPARADLLESPSPGSESSGRPMSPSSGISVHGQSSGQPAAVGGGGGDGLTVSPYQGGTRGSVPQTERGLEPTDSGNVHKSEPMLSSDSEVECIPESSTVAGSPHGEDQDTGFKVPQGVPAKKRARIDSSSSVGSSGDRDQVIFDMPVWNSDQEIEYEEVATTPALKFPEFLPSSSDGDDQLTGRWGEELVYNYLLTLKESNDSVVNVIWLNKERETGAPYDCEIDFYNSETQTIEKVFVEVKATVTKERTIFEISAPEVTFACEQKGSYHLYRVFSAGNQQNVRLMRLENLAEKLDKKQIRLYMMI